MAYSFNGTNQHLTVGSAPATGAPLSIAARFKKTGTATKNGLFLRSTVGNNLIGFYFGSSSSVRGFLQQSGTQPDWAAGGSYTTGQWGTVCVTLASTSSRTIYRDGGNSATNTTPCTPADINRLDIASANGATTFDGEFAEVGIWTVELTPEEVLAHANGYRCDSIRPQSLVFYAPLIRELIDTKGGLTITNNNSATVAVHPRVY